MAEEQKDDKPIFVEGNQDLFQYVLDYHRDRKVILPITASKKAVLHELKRFGLEATEDQIAEDEVSYASVRKRMADWNIENETKKAKLGCELLGRLFAEAAVKQKAAQEKGHGFVVSTEDLETVLGWSVKERTYLKVFGSVSMAMLEESESLSCFGKSFGYYVKVKAAEEGKRIGYWVVCFKPVS